MSEAASQLVGQLEGLSDIKLVGHSKGGAVVAQALIDIAAHRPDSRPDLRSAAIIDAPLKSGLATAFDRILARGMVKPEIIGSLSIIKNLQVPVLNFKSTDWRM